jgi:hypothetical protein
MELVGLIYRLEDMVSGWVIKKRKRDFNRPRPVKRRTAGLGGKPDFFNTNNKKDKNL